VLVEKGKGGKKKERDREGRRKEVQSALVVFGLRPVINVSSPILFILRKEEGEKEKRRERKRPAPAESSDTDGGLGSMLEAAGKKKERGGEKKGKEKRGKKKRGVGGPAPAAAIRRESPAAEVQCISRVPAREAAPGGREKKGKRGGGEKE